MSKVAFVLEVLVTGRPLDGAVLPTTCVVFMVWPMQNKKRSK